MTYISPIKPRSFSALVSPSVKRVARMVGFCLTNLDEASMWQLAAILNVRLRSGERKWLAVAALMALSDDEYQETMEFMEGQS